MKKLAIITTHPIQYNAPFFKLLTERNKVYPKVFYTWPQAIEGFDDPDFGKKVKWDIPLLDGYEWETVDNVSRSPSSKNWRGIDCPGLNQKIEEFNPDAVFIYGWNLKSHFRAMRYFKGRLPVWFFGDSTLIDEKPGLRKIMRRIALRMIYRYVDKAFYVGSNNMDYFLAHGLNNDQLKFFPHAIDNERFHDTDIDLFAMKAKKWRKELGYHIDDIVVMYAGKFEPRKNLNLLIDSVKIESKKENNVKLLLTGNGPLEGELIRSCKGYQNIKFIPFQNQSLMPIVYRLADLYCLPSRSETWGLVINEAMASGCPVLVSDKVGCAVDLVKHLETGAVFQANNKEDLALKLKSLLQLDLKRLGNKANQHIANWSFQKKCDAIEQNLLE